MSSNNKMTFLGLPYGTASHRLWRNVLHNLLLAHGENRCHVCGGAILTSGELSLEHKKPWEGRENGIELFWDLENIAFSHKRCNKTHNRGRKIGPEGTAWCAGCKKFLLDANFYPDR